VLDYGAIDGEFEGWRGGGRGACFGDEGFEDVVLGLLASGEGVGDMDGGQYDDFGVPAVGSGVVVYCYVREGGVACL
jgi:hypothetical protein